MNRKQAKTFKMYEPLMDFLNGIEKNQAETKQKYSLESFDFYDLKPVQCYDKQGAYKIDQIQNRKQAILAQGEIKDCWPQIVNFLFRWEINILKQIATKPFINLILNKVIKIHRIHPFYQRIRYTYDQYQIEITHEQEKYIDIYLSPLELEIQYIKQFLLQIIQELKNQALKNLDDNFQQMLDCEKIMGKK